MFWICLALYLKVAMKTQIWQTQVNHVDHDQFTANAEGRTDVELPDEGQIDHIVHHSDGEDALGSGVAEESVDLMAKVKTVQV